MNPQGGPMDKISQDIVVKYNELRKYANANPRFVVGGRIWRFVASDHMHSLYQGNLNSVGRKNHRSSYFCQPFSQQVIDDVVLSAKLGFRVRIPHVLKRRMTSRLYPTAKDGNRVLEVYDRFDEIFEKWIEENPQAGFVEEQGMLDPWWRTQIWNILETLQDCHEKMVFHGSMGFDSSYVVVDDTIHLIKLSNKRASDNTHRDQLIRQDLLDFQDFLVRNVDHSNYTSFDWASFINLFPHATVAELKKHPLLMDRVERFNYFQDINDALTYLSNNGGVPTNFRDLLSRRLKKYTSIQNWARKIVKGSIFEQVYKRRWYDVTNILDLLRFIRNLSRRFDELTDLHGLPDCRSEFEKVISGMYPGLLSFLHESIIFLQGDIGITSE